MHERRSKSQIPAMITLRAFICSVCNSRGVAGRDKAD